MMPLTYFLLTAAILLTTTGGSVFAGWALFGFAVTIQAGPAILTSLPVTVRRRPRPNPGEGVADYIPGDVPEPIIQRQQVQGTPRRLQEDARPGTGDVVLPEDTRITPVT